MKTKFNLLSKGVFALLAAIITHNFSFAQVKKDAKPNIILIYADDMGYGDLQSYGNTDARTPTIDGIGTEGVRFTQAYVTASICSPSRAGLITGKYQQSFGYEFQASSGPIGDPVYEKVRGVPETETTIAQFLKAQGYSTGVIGKWHLGFNDKFLPKNKGFDYFFGFNTNTSLLYKDTLNSYIVNKKIDAIHDKIAWTRNGLSAIKENDNVVDVEEYLTFRFADEASKFIEKNKEKPFFLYLPFNAPVAPLQVPASYYDKFGHIANFDKRAYIAALAALDDAVAKVLNTLKQNGLEENTIVFFISDNGGPTTRVANNSPLKGGKFGYYEGGIRIPYFIKWPGKIPAGTVYEKPVSTLDVFATIADAVNTPLPKDKQGVSLLPFLNSSNDKTPHEKLFWRYGAQKAARVGDWKLIKNGEKLSLYNIEKDKEEIHEISSQNKKKTKELLAELENWEKTLKAPLWPETSSSPNIQKTTQ